MFLVELDIGVLQIRDIFKDHLGLLSLFGVFKRAIMRLIISTQMTR